MKKENLYIKSERILQRRVTHTINLEDFKNEIIRRLQEGDFRLVVNNAQPTMKNSAASLDLSLEIGNDVTSKKKEITPIISLSADLNGEDIAKLLKIPEILYLCKKADTKCEDTKILITKILEEEDEDA